MSECEELSDFDKDRYSATFIWVIEDVFNFLIPELNISKICLCRFGVGKRLEGICTISLFTADSAIKLKIGLNMGTQHVIASLSLGVLDRDFNKKHEVTKSHQYHSSKSSVCFGNFLSRELLIEHKKTLLHNEDLILIGKLTMCVFPDREHISDSSIPIYSHFSQNMGTLLKDGAFSDFSISVHGKKFLCHKAVLAARSAYFEALFNSCMKESETQELLVTDNEADVMEQILSYIYTNTLDITPSNAVPILYAAEKYLLHDLKLICENKMHGYFSFDNCDELLEIANMYDLPTIKVRALHMRTLFTKQVVSGNGGYTLNRIKVKQEAVKCDCEALHDVKLEKVNSVINSFVNPNIELGESFLPYADLWIASNKHALFEKTWRIKNFADLKHSGTLMMTTLFDDFDKGYEMKIKASCNSNEVEQMQYSVKLKFSVLSCQNEKSLMEFRSSIVPVLGDLINCKTYFANLKVNEVADAFSMNISHRDLNSLLQNGDLLISCKCCILNWTCYRNKAPNPDNQLIADFSRVYTSPKFSDLIIKVGRSEFHCHKAMVSCRSRFFAQMLKERKNDLTITLDDIDEKTFEKILRYIYTDQCEFVEADASELLQFSFKYELEHLKVMCENI